MKLYPRAWRERYGEEFEALLEECLHSPLDVVDIALGALDVHLGLGHEVNWRSMNMVNKRRTAILLVFAGYIGFVVAGLSLYGLVDDSPAAPLLQTNAALALAWHAVQAAAVVALAAIVVGGLPLALTVIRRAVTTSRRDLRWLLVPVAAFLAVALYGGLLAAVAFGAVQIPGVARSVAPDNFPVGNRTLLGGFMVVFAAGAAASTMAVWKVVSNSEAEVGTLTLGGRTTSVQLYQLAFPLSVVAAACMLVMLAGTLTFGWLAGSALPQWFAGNYGLLLTPTTLSFGLTVAIMVLSTAAAVVGLMRGLSTRAQAAG
ncbi:MAG TPA: hypothetical protein VLD63_08665 [Anaerolineales bacterium]|nr:hypothetical protein [Anaerolineales bacterium]